MSESLRISLSDRFDRFRSIDWWDQERLSRAKVLVVGAGALGNEIVKNLALLGVGNLLVADLDSIENSNLSRSILYRESDNGQPKAVVAARAARSIYAGVKVQSFHGDVVGELGLGVFRWADITLGGLDNREARLAINRYCFKLGKPWIDGAIEQIQGNARFFSPNSANDGPCYECTMSERDWKILQHRRSCNLLSRSEMEAGRTPTTPTIGSIIAGVQCQEAVKYLHGLPTLAGKGWVFEGMSGDSYAIDYQRKPECGSHEALDEVVALDAGAASLTAAELLRFAREVAGQKSVVEFPREIVEKFVCPKCGGEEQVFAPISRIRAARAACPKCAGTHREVVTFFRLCGEEPFLDRPLASIGAQAFDILFASGGERYVGLELAADARSVLGELALEASGNGEGEVEWL